MLPPGDSRMVSQSTSAERSRGRRVEGGVPDTGSGVPSQRASASPVMASTVPASGDAVGGIAGEGDGVGPGVGVVGRVGEGGEHEGATVAARAGVALDDGEPPYVR